LTTWQRGREIITENRTAKEGALDDFIEALRENPVPRVAGTAVFPHPTKTTTPLALRANVEHNHILHEHVVIVSALAQNTPHVHADDQLSVDDLGYTNDGIVHLTVRYGFADSPDIPRALRAARDSGSEEVDIDPDTASYFVSRASLRHINAPGMQRWRKRLFVGLAQHATNPVDYFGLPPGRTIVMGSQVEL
jgi:KUP system potassium uptake protein